MASLEEAVSQLVQTLNQSGIGVAETRSIAYGTQLLVTDGQEKVPVNVYSGKKGISITLGGSKTSRLRQQLESVLAVPSSPAARAAADETLSFEGVEGFDGCWIGTDESGKGDFFGPLVVSAVMVDRETEAQLIQRGIKDCKLLSDDKVKVMAAAIREICHNRYTELELIPSRYNSLYQTMRSEGKNLNQLLAWAHARAIEDILEKAPCRFAIADQFADEKQILSRLMEKGKKLTLLQSHRAERNIAVAAASVLARDRFLARLDSFRLEYGMDFPKGASEAVVTAGRKFAAEKGRQQLVDVAKTHFRTMEQI